jgi:hypothetical protein
MSERTAPSIAKLDEPIPDSPPAGTPDADRLVEEAEALRRAVATIHRPSGSGCAVNRLSGRRAMTRCRGACWGSRHARSSRISHSIARYLKAWRRGPGWRRVHDGARVRRKALRPRTEA